MSQRESSLARVVAEMLPALDAWGLFAHEYLSALDRVTAEGAGRASGGGSRTDRADRLSEWHGMLLERLAGSDYEDRLDRLVEHPALVGPERTFLQARLAEMRGDPEAARVLVGKCLAALPGHREFRAFAERVGAAALTPRQ